MSWFERRRELGEWKGPGPAGLRFSSAGIVAKEEEEKQEEGKDNAEARKEQRAPYLVSRSG